MTTPEKDKATLTEAFEQLRRHLEAYREPGLAAERWLWEKVRASTQFQVRLSPLEARSELRALMRDLSEQYYAAGWLNGLEFELWTAVVDGPQFFGLGWLTARDCLQLAVLARRANGWWSWPDDAEEEIFLPMPEWLQVAEGKALSESEQC